MPLEDLSKARRSPPESTINFGVPGFSGAVRNVEHDLGAGTQRRRRRSSAYEPRIRPESLRVRLRPAAGRRSDADPGVRHPWRAVVQAGADRAVFSKPRSTSRRTPPSSTEHARAAADGSAVPAPLRRPSCAMFATWAPSSHASFRKSLPASILGSIDVPDPYVERLLEGLRFPDRPGAAQDRSRIPRLLPSRSCRWSIRTTWHRRPR